MLRELSDAHMVEVLAEYSLTMVDLPTMSMLYAVVASGLVSYLMAAIFFSVSDIGNARPRPPRAADGVEEGTGTGTAVATG